MKRASEIRAVLISKRVAPFLLVVAIQLLIATASVQLMSIVRTYVAAESLWSKGEQQASYYLDRYIDTGDELYYRKYIDSLAIPMAILTARRSVEAPRADFGAAAQALLRAGYHPDDIPGAIWLYFHFRDYPYLAQADALWRKTDPFLMELSVQGDLVRAAVTNHADRSELEAMGEDIHDLDERLRPIDAAFAASLGAASRAVAIFLTLANILVALLLTVLIIVHMHNKLRQDQNYKNALRSERELAQTTLQSIGDAVVRIGADGCVNYMNPAAERLFGVGKDAVLGAPLISLVSIVGKAGGFFEKNGLVEAILGDARIEIGPESALLLHSAAGSTPVSLVGARIEADGETVGGVLVLHDMTSEQEFIARLSWQARHDPLTGLLNRGAFDEGLEESLQALAGHPRANALMLLDLDQFKIVNDTCGHAAGDRLLRDISALLQAELREDDLAARLGGDEFAVLVHDRTLAEASEIAERLRMSIEQTMFVWGGRSFNTSASIGLVPLSTPDATAGETLISADIACYQAKENGRNRVHCHLPTDSNLQHRIGEMAWVQKIRDALEKNLFCLYAQEIAPASGKAHGKHVEVLLRLRDEHGALVPPNSFLPSAEKFGLMPLIDRWVVEAAFSSLEQRRAQPETEWIASCSINLSAGSVGDPAFTDFVREQFARHEVEPSRICFEITETGAIGNLDAAAEFISSFQNLGVRFALDDFGVGMCSLSYLKRLPVDYLKIDGSFVRDMLTDRTDRATVEMIVNLAKSTGKQTIAEFVASEELVEAARAMGVDYLQGYAIGKPEQFSDLCARPDLPWAVGKVSAFSDKIRADEPSSHAA